MIKTTSFILNTEQLQSVMQINNTIEIYIKDRVVRVLTFDDVAKAEKEFLLMLDDVNNHRIEA